MFRLSALSVFLFSCASDKGVQAYNSNPEATITSHSSGVTLSVGEEVTFTATVSDANHETNTLLVTWKTDGRTLCEETAPESSGETACTVALEEGDESIIVQVVDPEGAAGIDSLDIILNANIPPEVEILSPESTGLYYSGDLILFSAQISDVEDAAVQLLPAWTSSIDGALGSGNNADSSGLMEEFFALSAGEHALTLSVTDLDGATTTRSKSIIVLAENSPPSCSIESPITGDSFVEGQSIVFSAVASDTESVPNDLILSWISDKDGALGTGLINSQGEVTFSLSDLSTDTHTIQFNVEDEGGDICSDTILVSIGNPPNIVLNTPISGEIITFGETVSFSGTVEDSQDVASALSISWESDHDGVFSTQGAFSDGSILLNTNLLSAGLHNITVTATDSTGLTDAEALTIRINQLPTSPTVFISPDPATASQNISATASGSTDLDGQVVTYTYEWYQNGLVTSQATSSINSSLTSAGDTWLVRVTPNDGFQDGAYSESSIEILESAPQFDVNAEITPSSGITPSSFLTCSGSAYDPDGGTISYTYEWENINQSASLGSSASLQLSSTSAQSGDQIQCTITATDSDAEQSTSSALVTVDNNPPVITSLQLSPASLYTNDTPTVSISASDPEGQILSFSYSWSVNNQVVQTGVNNTLPSSLFVKGDLVSVEATVDDGSASTSQTTSLTCLNTPPEAPSISLSPSAPTVGMDDLVCSLSGTSSDLDGDTVSYGFSWTVNGTPFTSATNTSSSSTVSQYDTSSGDDWICTITPNDGDDDGVAVSATVQISSSWDGALMFSNCGQTGPNGPDQTLCDGEYSGSYLDGFVSVSAGFQTWEVTSSGTYSIEVAGAQGGYTTGANGATMYGDFALNAGDVLTIAVGQSGNNGTGSGGGGGGTFVALNSSPLIIAGGGGGGHYNNTSTPIGGQTSQQGLSNPTTGNGYSGASGGGWFSDGANGDTGTTGGKSWSNGLTGGSNTSQTAWSTSPGGFGGGGGPCWSPGGGGGYYGGVTPPSYGNGTPGGSGGGSYNLGTNHNNTSASNAGHGYVIIDMP